VFLELALRTVQKLGSKSDLSEEGGQSQGKGKGDDKKQQVGVQGDPPKAVDSWLFTVGSKELKAVNCGLVTVNYLFAL
jgi:hypothetical protein